MTTASSPETIDAYNLQALLEKNGLKKTAPRLCILSFISSRQEAVTRACLAKAFEGQVDRSTLYRLLKIFVKKNILHKLIDCKGTTAYSFFPQQAARQQQMHFNCTRCNNLYCLQEKHLPAVQLPTGFTREFSSFITYGICRTCNGW